MKETSTTQLINQLRVSLDFYQKAQVYLNGGFKALEKDNYFLAAVNILQAGEFYYKIISVLLLEKNHKDNLAVVIKILKKSDATKNKKFPIYNDEELSFWAHIKDTDEYFFVSKQEKITKGLLRKTERLNLFVKRLIKSKVGEI